MRFENIKKASAVITLILWGLFYFYSSFIDSLFLNFIKNNVFELYFLKYILWLTLVGISAIPLNILLYIKNKRIDFFRKNRKNIKRKRKRKSIDIIQAKTTLKHYIVQLNLPKEIKSRIENMYFKELEHIFSMNESIKTLRPFKKNWNGIIFDSNDFLVKTEEELVNKTIENVNRVFGKFIYSEKQNIHERI